MRTGQIENKQLNVDEHKATVVAIEGRTAILETPSGERLTARFAVFTDGEPAIGRVYTIERTHPTHPAVMRARS